MGFLQAFALPFQALRLIRRDATLRRLTLISALVSALCFAGLFAGLWYAAPKLLGLLWSKPDDWLIVLWVLSAALLFLISFVIGAQTLPIIVLAPLSERLSIQTEQVLGITNQDGGLVRFVVETGRSLQKALLRVMVLVAGHLVLLLLWLIPGPGHAAWTVATLCWSVVWIAFEYIDITANRHGLTFLQVVGFLNAHPGATLGLGLAIYLVLWVPIVNVFFMPIAVVSATLLYRANQNAKAS